MSTSLDGLTQSLYLQAVLLLLQLFLEYISTFIKHFHSHNATYLTCLFCQKYSGSEKPIHSLLKWQAFVMRKKETKSNLSEHFLPLIMKLQPNIENDTNCNLIDGKTRRNLIKEATKRPAANNLPNSSSCLS